MSTTETERYLRITLLTHKGGIWIGKKILFRELGKIAGSQTLDALLLSKKPQLFQKKKHGEITKRQYETLFPTSRANTDVEEWDLSIIIKIVLFLFDQTLPTQESDDLKKILKIRNEIVSHATYPSLKDQEFSIHWTDLAMSINGLASGIDMKTKEDASDLIQSLNRGPLDLQSSIERVAQLCRNDEYMENMLTTLQRQQNEVATGVVESNRILDEILAGVRNLIRIHDDEGQCRVEIPMLNSTVTLSGNEEDVVKLAEDVLLKVMQSAIDIVPDQTDDNDVRNAVQQLLSDLESNGGTGESTESGSIVLKIRCKTLKGLENILRLFRINGLRYRLDDIEKALNAMFKNELKLDFFLPEDTLDFVKKWIDKCLSALSDTISVSEDGAQEYKRSINLGIKCDSAEAAIDVVKYLRSGKSANRLNQIAEAVSEVVGDKIKIEAVPDVEGFSRALSANIQSVAPSSQRETYTVNEQPPVEHAPHLPVEMTSRPLRDSSKLFALEDTKLKSKRDSTDDDFEKNKSFKDILEKGSEAIITGLLEPRTSNAAPANHDSVINPCSRCEKKDDQIEADCFCKTCQKHYCRHCRKKHGQFVNDHDVILFERDLENTALRGGSDAHFDNPCTRCRGEEAGCFCTACRKSFCTGCRLKHDEFAIDHAVVKSCPVYEDQHEVLCCSVPGHRTDDTDGAPNLEKHIAQSILDSFNTKAQGCQEKVRADTKRAISSLVDSRARVKTMKQFRSNVDASLKQMEKATNNDMTELSSKLNQDLKRCDQLSKDFQKITTQLSDARISTAERSELIKYGQKCTEELTSLAQSTNYDSVLRLKGILTVTREDTEIHGDDI